MAARRSLGAGTVPALNLIDNATVIISNNGKHGS